MTRLIGLLALCALLSGCSFGPPEPPFTDAFAGLYSQSAATVPADVPTTVQHPVGIILSDNVEAYIRWLGKSDEAVHQAIPANLINTVAENDANPNYISGRFLDMLKRHFPEAQVVHDFNAAVSSGKKAVVLLDIQTVLPCCTGQKVILDATTYFFDAQMNPVSKMSGHADFTIGFPATSPHLQELTDAAVAQIDAKITALVH